MLWRLFGIALFSLLLHASLASAQDYPTKPVRMVVPWPPGGTADLVTRQVSQKLQEMWHQPVVIDNRGGAAGNIGAELVAHAAPDGYTLMYGAMSTHAMNQWLYPNMAFDPVRDFEPICNMLVATTVLLAPANSPAADVKQLIEMAKQRPGKLNYASVGQGSFSHLAAELLKQSAGIDVVHVPYKGGAPALTDLLANRVDFLFIAAPAAMPHIRSGKLKVLATGDATRAPAFPNVQTVAEVVPGFDISVWSGILGPAGMPPDIVNKINADIRKVLAQPEMRTRIAEQGAVIVAGTPQEFGARMRADAEKWGRIIKTSGAKAE
jgi:tripartite-type tricarboxylate transporter receptor subunit TctC